MGLDEMKAKFGNKSFASLIKSTKKNKKQRLVSDVEFLDQEQYEFLEGYTQQKFFSFMEQYWGEKLVDAEITCKTFDGEVINIDRGSIRVIDKRWKGASHCICGKAIRYEYWIGSYGPIGSVHIVEHTNLDKTLVRDITKGYKTENTLRTDIVRMLADLKEDEKTYEDWVVSYELAEKMKYIDAVRSKERRELIMKLCDLKLPLPESLRKELMYAISSTKRKLREQQQQQTTPVAVLNNPNAILANEIESSLAKYQTGNFCGISQHHLRTLGDLLSKIKQGKPSSGQVSYAQALLDRVKEACQQPASTGWTTAQQTAKKFLTLIVNSDVSNSFARSLHAASQNGDLTIRQLDCIFAKKAGRGKPGLYYQYPNLVNANQISVIDPASYQN